MTLRFVIPGEPQAQQSFRFGVVKGRVLKYQPKGSHERKGLITMAIRSQLPPGFEIWNGNIVINKALFVFSPLKSFSKKKIDLIKLGKLLYKNTKPDLADNLKKGVYDAMQGVVFVNDSQIVRELDSAKVYGFEPRTEIELELVE